MAIIDRREALKSRSRRAILDAASSLMAERGGPRFTVDELAQRADVARRTIFNHFASVDDVVLAVSEDTLSVVVEKFSQAADATPVGDGSRASMFDEIAQTLRTIDLPSAIVPLVRSFGLSAEDLARFPKKETDERWHQRMKDAFDRVGARLAREVERRNPGADQLDVELLVTSLLSGVPIIATHWLLSTQQADPATAQAVWDSLLDRLIESNRNGYLPARRRSPRPTPPE